MTRMLVVEDDTITAQELRAALEDHGFEVDHAQDGKAGLLKAAAGGYDAIILDRMLPGELDGLGVLSTLRAVGVEVPVLIVSALSAVDERVRGLKAGGDDYLVKPVEFVELTARVEALLRRRTAPTRVSRLQVGDLELDLITHRVTRAGRALDLLPREYELLEYLMRQAGQVVTRTMLFEQVWKYHYPESSNVIDVHISKLRRKIDPEGASPMIQTIRGAGYILNAAS
ncbi:DNA-binding response regulator [Azorhizobium oxalatiphilum]|uniref:DNA-binding response regulator n=1 Tax=Azorhizobium oxalatiphilum TaxID=980631 RepID=A0A917BQK9_9HYPH|nr:response regulator transcription factor [Azorhizobium oxalatiphilum]GGF50822.1 DNA-binding response regulator [Azorhizobium oxalatiphilum]